MADRRRLKRRFRVAASVLLGIAAGEAALRALWPQPPVALPASAFEERDGLAYLRPGVRLRHASSEFDVEVVGSALGYRADVGGDDPQAALWVLGDSIAFGWGVSSTAAATTRAARTGARLVNLAIPGDGILEYLRRLRALAAGGQRPAAVVVVLYDNDLIAREAVRTGPNDLVGSLRSASARRRRAGLLFTLAELHLSRLAWRSLRASGLGSVAERAVGLRSQFEGLLREELSVQRRGYVSSREFATHVGRLRELTADAASLGASVCVVRVAAYWTSGGAPTRSVLQELGERIEDFDFAQLDRALSERLETLDVCYARFPPEARGLDAADYFAWDRHLTASGQAGLGRMIGELARRLEATRPRASAVPGPGRG